VYEHVLCDLQIDGRCLASPVEICRNHLVCCVIYNSLATCHVSEKDDVLLTRSPISHSTTVIPSNRRNALALNTINRHTLILIGGRGREEGVLVWGGDVYCAILIGVVLRDRACHTREELIQYTNSEVGRGTG
jgi:hypothetical protein